MEFCDPCFALLFKLRIVRHVNILRNLRSMCLSEGKIAYCLFNGTQGAKRGRRGSDEKGSFRSLSRFMDVLKTLIAGSFELIGLQDVLKHPSQPSIMGPIWGPRR